MLQTVVDAYLSMMHLTDEECLKPNRDSIPSDDNWHLRVEGDCEQSNCYTENETKDESRMTWLLNPNCTNLRPFVPDEHDVQQQQQPRRTKFGRRPSSNVQHYWWGEFLRRTFLQEILLWLVKSLGIPIKRLLWYQNSLFHHWNTWGWLPQMLSLSPLLPHQLRPLVTGRSDKIFLDRQRKRDTPSKCRQRDEELFTCGFPKIPLDEWKFWCHTLPAERLSEKIC